EPDPEKPERATRERNRRAILACAAPKRNDGEQHGAGEQRKADDSCFAQRLQCEVVRLVRRGRECRATQLVREAERPGAGAESRPVGEVSPGLLPPLETGVGTRARQAARALHAVRTCG